MERKKWVWPAVTAVAVLVAVAALATRGGGGAAGPQTDAVAPAAQEQAAEVDNTSPEATAALFMKAMVTQDWPLMQAINRAPDYPTFHLMETATEFDYERYDLSQFRYKYLDRGVVEVTYPDGMKSKMQLVEDRGRWYFSGWK